MPERTPTSVLVVEDDPLTQRALEHLLEPHQRARTIEVRYCDGADAARAAFEARPAAIVVCDLYLPKKDGLLLGEELRRIAPTRLLFMGVGRIEPSIIARAATRLDAAVFSKPLELPDLVATVSLRPSSPPAPRRSEPSRARGRARSRSADRRASCSICGTSARLERYSCRAGASASTCPYDAAHRSPWRPTCARRRSATSWSNAADSPSSSTSRR
jgi:DNA-binding NtrC family response regulator